MERLLARLERTLGRFAIPNLPIIIVGGMALVFILLFMKPETIEYLLLDKSLALKQPWRFVTYLFIPRSLSLIWIIFSLSMTWLVLNSLNEEWGAFKLNVYYLVGILGTTAAAWITGLPQGNFWLNTSLFLAFATAFPNYEIRLYFVIPVRAKWLALAAVAYMGWDMIEADNGARAAAAVAMGNYLLFFTGHLVALARGQQLQMKQAARRASMRPPPRRNEDDDGEEGGKASGNVARSDSRVCAICGKTQSDGADIRVCSCEKCGGPRELCLEHARNH